MLSSLLYPQDLDTRVALKKEKEKKTSKTEIIMILNYSALLVILPKVFLSTTSPLNHHRKYQASGLVFVNTYISWRLEKLELLKNLFSRSLSSSRTKTSSAQIGITTAAFCSQQFCEHCLSRDRLVEHYHGTKQGWFSNLTRSVQRVQDPRAPDETFCTVFVRKIARNHQG